MIRSIKQAVFILFGIVLSATWVGARAEPTEYEVKAAFIHNIAKFVEWPGAARATDKLRLCILGENPYGRWLDALQGQAIGDKVWEVSSASPQTNLHKCSVLFITESVGDNLGQILNEVKKDAVLTIGDTSGYAKQGVIVNFYLEQDKVRFEINNVTAERAGLKISSKLLKLARIVPDAGGTK